MVDYPIVRFVADCGDTTARLDMNDGDPWTTRQENFDFGAPSLEVDPQALGTPYGERQITAKFRVDGGEDVAFPALGDLSVELMRARNWLMVQWNESASPVWLRLYAPKPQALALEDAYADDDDGSRWYVNVEIPAEAFAYGEEVELEAIDIKNDPTASTGNAATYALPAIKGDAPAPLNVLLTDTSAGAHLRSPLVSVTTTTDAYDYPLISSDWSFSGVSKTTNSNYVAGGYYAVDNDGTLTVTPPFAGRYKALMRCAFTVLEDEWRLNLGKAGQVRVAYPSSPWGGWGTDNDIGWVDMGVVALGGGYSSVLNPTLETELDLVVTHVSGSGKIRIDTVLFIPVDGEDTEARTMYSDPLIGLGGGMKYEYDSQSRQMFVAAELLGTYYPFLFSGLSGRFPQVWPGRHNTLHILRNVNTGKDDKTEVTEVTLSYRPRYLYPLAAGS